MTPAQREVSPAKRRGVWPEGFVRGRADRDALLLLAHVEGVEPRRIHGLAHERGTAGGCLAAVRSGDIGTQVARDTIAAIELSRVRAVLARRGARVAVPGDGDYVSPLLDLWDPPAALFVRGRPVADALEGPAVAIVGARRCSPYGREVAEQLGAELAGAGVTVVSGAALGVDAAAHRGALRANGVTIAVLGSGIDVAYPRANRELIEEIARRGTLVSEYPPGRPALPRQFPARNRIIAAFASAVVVVEGAEDSGSLITAELALDLDRDVTAVPGQVTSALSVGPNDLIHDGAPLVRSADDVLDLLGMGPRSTEARSEGDDGLALAGVPEEQANLLHHVSGAATVDAIAAAADVPPGRALTLLSALELRGLVRAAGGRYERAMRRSPGTSAARGKGRGADVAKGEG